MRPPPPVSPDQDAESIVVVAPRPLVGFGVLALTTGLLAFGGWVLAQGSTLGWVMLGLTLPAAVLGLLATLTAPRLTIDARGFTWRVVGRTRRVAWGDIADVLAVPERAGPGCVAIGLTEDARAGRSKRILRIDLVRVDLFVPALVNLPARSMVPLLRHRLARWRRLHGKAPVTPTATPALAGTILDVRTRDGHISKVAMLGGHDYAELATRAAEIVKRIVDTQRHDASFSGDVLVVLIPPLTPEVPALYERMDAAMGRVRSTIAGQRTRDGRAIRARWQYGEVASDGARAALTQRYGNM